MITKSYVLQKLYGLRETYSLNQLLHAEEVAKALEQEAIAKKDEYKHYLKSREWRVRWQAVMRRDRKTCRICKRRDAKQVHHLTYVRIFNEPLYDLIAVCDECHRRLHALDKEKNED